MNGAGRWAWAEIDLDAVTHNVEVLRAAVAPAARVGGRQGRRIRARRRCCRPGRARGRRRGAVCRARVGRRRRARGRHRRTDPRVVGATDRVGAHDRRAPLDAHGVHRKYVDALVGAEPDHLPVHLKIDTGMQRVGAHPARRRRPRGVDPGTLTGGGADRRLHPSRRRRRAGRPVHRHPTGAVRRRAHPRARRAAGPRSPNSAGALAHPAARRSFVRAGIAVYGISPGRASTISAADLRPVMSLKARVSYVKTARVGQPDLLRAAVPVLTRHHRGDHPARLRRRRAAASVVDERPAGRLGADPRRALPDRRHHHDGSADGRLRRPRRRTQARRWC